MLPGISTACFYPWYTEDALRALTKYPIASTEVFFNCIYELEPPYLLELRKMADDAGIRILSVHPYTSGMEPMYFFSNYDRRFAEGMELYRRYYQAASILGADIVVFHGALKFVQMRQEECITRFVKLHEDAKKHGMRLCHENVERCIGYHPDYFSALRKAIPDAGFVLDTKQCIRAGHEIMDYVNAMGKNIAHIHISDHSPGKDCQIPGAGVFNIPKFLNMVRKSGFNGGVMVELYQDNYDDIVEIYAGYQHICTALSTIGDFD